MLAKLVAFGATRAAAASTLQQGLHELVLLGVPTNIDYLARVLRHPQFLAGQLHTAFLVQYAQDLLPPEAPEQAAAATLAALLTDADFRHAAFDVPEPHATIGAWRN
jgi:propionyl-CoA carboxylase alpha chain/3-methylcrotonyl-CoA carboxylase alpha subunit/acetyl-CoA/propionyl-CoA carboxylase biotin carboxyl carrier protein